MELPLQAIGLDKSNPDRDRLIEEAMNAMYDHFATYDESSLNKFALQLEIFEVEKMLDNEFLPLKSDPIYDADYQGTVPAEISTYEDARKVLDYIVHQTREDLSKWNDLKNEPLSQQCIDTSWKLEKICANIGIQTIHIGVNQDLGHGMFHHFTIVRVPFSNETHRNYLADCTYRQFFTKYNSNPRRIGVTRGPQKGCGLGYFMIIDDKRKRIAEEILQKGYIEATPEVIKAYFDGIVFSGRGKDYYEQNGIDYLNPEELVVQYTASEYMEIVGKVLCKKEKSISDVVGEILTSKELCPSQEDVGSVGLGSDELSIERGDGNE